jgi:hypothetical protein
MSSRKPSGTPPADSNARIEKMESVIEKMQAHLEKVTAESSRASPAPVATNLRKYKVREPEFFDGGPNSNLRNLFAQVQLIFRDNPADFPDDSKKVIYVISHFRGAASSWIEPYLERSELPAWGSDFTLFKAELKRVFGHANHYVKVVHDLFDLKQTGSVPVYAVAFRQLASRLQWSDQPLVAHFYQGLKTPLRAELVKTKDFFEMELEDFIALAVNTEIVLDQQDQEQSSKRHSRPTKRGSPDDPSENSRAAVGHSGSRSARSNDSRSPFRPLTEKEKNYRRENNLCVYCGDKGHSVTDCPVRSKYRPRFTRPAGAATTGAQTSGKGHAQSK